MILIRRGKEPAELKLAHQTKMPILRAIAASGKDPHSDDIKGYEVAAEKLWEAQHHKCCYCEKKIEKSYNDVEHFRPKAGANRLPGSSSAHGYWWLAFTWNNLLFACDCCNRSHKKTRFPLAIGSAALVAEGKAPSKEQALILDPAAKINPVEHIEFELNRLTQKWIPRPRNGSVLGSLTIEVCGLDRPQLLGLYKDHVKTYLDPQINRLKVALKGKKKDDIALEFKHALAMLAPESNYVGLSYDVFRANIANKDLQLYLQTEWPTPSEVGLRKK